MTTYTLPSETSYNFTEHLGNSLLYLQDNIPSLTTWLLWFLFFIISIGGFMVQRRTDIDKNILTWFTIAGLICTIVSVILLVGGYVTEWTTVIFLVLTIFMFILSSISNK